MNSDHAPGETERERDGGGGGGGGGGVKLLQAHARALIDPTNTGRPNPRGHAVDQDNFHQGLFFHHSPFVVCLPRPPPPPPQHLAPLRRRSRALHSKGKCRISPRVRLPVGLSTATGTSRLDKAVITSFGQSSCTFLHRTSSVELVSL